MYNGRRTKKRLTKNETMDNYIILKALAVASQALEKKIHAKRKRIVKARSKVVLEDELFELEIRKAGFDTERALLIEAQN
jgi:hypothetical protein